MSDCFAQTGFAQRNFIQGCPVGPLHAIDEQRIPRWLLKFERIGQTTYLSDVGGEVEGQFYIPAIVAVSHSDLEIDLARMSIPKPAATVTVSPSALHEHFLDVNELGQARVTISSWDGYTARRIVAGDMAEPGWGYNGDPSTFRLTEEFRYNPTFPELLVNYGPKQGFTRAELVDGARFRAYLQVWGSARKVPGFALRADETSTRWMIAGHPVNPLPSGEGTEARYRDLAGHQYIGAEFTDPPSSPFWDFNKAQKIATAGDLLQFLIAKHSTYPESEIDIGSLSALYGFLSQFPAAGYVDQEGPLFNLIESELQREFMFVLFSQGGLLRGAAIDPSAEPARVLVHGVQLLELEDEVKPELRYNRFKIRYRYRTTPSTGWYGVADVGSENPILKASLDRWGYRDFGDPVEWKRHSNSVDCPDIEADAAARAVLWRYVSLFHRGEKAPYLQLAEAADMPFGEKVALVDPERDYDEKPAILIGRRWLTPELLIHKFRTVEPFEPEEKPRATVGGAGGVFACWDTSPPFTLVPNGAPGGVDGLQLANLPSTISVESPTCAKASGGSPAWVELAGKAITCSGPMAGSAAFGFRFFVNVFTDAACTILESQTGSTSMITSGGGGNLQYRLDLLEYIPVPASRYVTVDIDLRATNGSTSMVYDVAFAIVPAAGTYHATQVTLGPC